MLRNRERVLFSLFTGATGHTPCPVPFCTVPHAMPCVLWPGSASCFPSQSPICRSDEYHFAVISAIAWIHCILIGWIVWIVWIRRLWTVWIAWIFRRCIRIGWIAWIRHLGTAWIVWIRCIRIGWIAWIRVVVIAGCWYCRSCSRT